MTEEAVKAVFNQVRNGANYMVRHYFVRTFLYSDGVKDFCTAAGAYWFLDIVATALHTEYMQDGGADGTLGVVKLRVKEGGARITLSLDDDAPHSFTTHVTYTDCPDGEYTFLIQYDGESTSFILVSEY